MTGQTDVHKYYDHLDRKDIVLSYRGEVTPDMMTALLEIVEDKLERLNEPSRVRKKVFNILVECIQNLFHHNSQPPSLTDGQVGDTSVLIVLAQTPAGFSVITGNYMHSSEVDRLRGRLEEINNLSRENLQSKYRQVLNDGKISDKGGGGLGIIDIARRSGKKLNFDFKPNNGTTFFSLNIEIDQKADIKQRG